MPSPWKCAVDEDPTEAVQSRLLAVAEKLWRMRLWPRKQFFAGPPVLRRLSQE